MGVTFAGRRHRHRHRHGFFGFRVQLQLQRLVRLSPPRLPGLVGNRLPLP